MTTFGDLLRTIYHFRGEQTVCFLSLTLDLMTRVRVEPTLIGFSVSGSRPFCDMIGRGRLTLTRSEKQIHVFVQKSTHTSKPYFILPDAVSTFLEYILNFFFWKIISGFSTLQ